MENMEQILEKGPSYRASLYDGLLWGDPWGLFNGDGKLDCLSI